MDQRAWLGWLGVCAAGAAALGAMSSCSTLADDCLEGRCWEPEGASGGAGASTSSGGGQGGGGLDGGGGQGGGQGGQGGQGGSPSACGDGVVDPGEVCFTLPLATYDLASGDASDMVVSDCDGDEDADLIVVTEENGSFTALRNDGGVLTAETAWLSGLSDTIRIALAETDGLGGDELYGAGNTVGFGPAILRYDIADCGFTGSSSHAGSALPTDIAVVRFSGDQLDDPVALARVTNPSLAGKISYRLDGTTQGTCTLVDLGTPNPGGMAVAQLLGDAFLDLAYVDWQAGTVFVRRNNGSGFDAASWSIAVPGTPGAVAAGDFDDDGDADLVVAAATGNFVRLLRNDGSGTFTPAPPDLPIDPSQSVAATSPGDVGLVDIDLDGDLDVITANFCNPAQQEGSVSLFLNDGSGAFVAATAENLGAAVGEDFPIAVARHPTTVRVVDLNGDGALDIVTTSGFGDGANAQVSVLLADP